MSSGAQVNNRKSIWVFEVNLYDFWATKLNILLKVFLQKILEKLQSRKSSKALNKPERA